MNVIALDGHDGAGKTTIAQAVAQKLNYKYIKPYDGNLGDMIAWCWGRKDYDLAYKLARAALSCEIEKYEAANDNSQRGVVLDRAWITMFTVLPNSYWELWQPREKSILCWTGLSTTISRLTARGEPILDSHEHQKYVTLYRDIAAKFNVPVLDTTHTTVEDATKKIIETMLW